MILIQKNDSALFLINFICVLWVTLRKLPPVKSPKRLSQLLRAPKLTRTRMVLALTIALLADGLQMLLGPLGWAGIDQAVDLVAMILVNWMIGFHILLLPTFVTELIPLVDDLPTWTACTVGVIALRKREQRKTSQPDPIHPTIEV
jgi:hypothetical protein